MTLDRTQFNTKLFEIGSSACYVAISQVVSEGKGRLVASAVNHHVYVALVGVGVVAEGDFVGIRVIRGDC